MKYRDLREFIAGLEADGKLKRIQHPVSPHLEMTEIADRVLRTEGPALLFETRLSPTVRATIIQYWRTCSARPNAWLWAWGADSVSKLREIGQTRRI